MSDTPSFDELIGYRRLLEFSKKVLSAYELTDLLETLADSILSITRADHVLLFLMDNDLPVVRVARTFDGQNISVEEQRFSQTLVFQTLASCKALLVRDALEDIELSESPSVQDLSLRSMICVPICHQGVDIGLIYVCSRTYADLFSECHLELVSIFSMQAGLLISESLRYQALQESEQRHRSLVELFPEAIAVCVDRKIVFINSAGAKLLGAESADKLEGRAIDEFLCELSRGDNIEAAGSANSWLLTLDRQEVLEATEVDFQRLDGEILSVEISGSPIFYDRMRAQQLVIRDMTHRKRVLSERMRLDRLVAMGTLAAGVGHEINNPLSYVHTNMDYSLTTITDTIAALEQHMNAGEPVQPDVLQELIKGLHDSKLALISGLDGTSRIREVVRSIQSFSRLDNEENPLVRVDGPLEFSINLALSDLRYRARLVRNLRPTPLVAANESRLGQVFLNLLINAVHAIPEGNPGENTISVSSYATGGNVIVEVRDTGCGIPASLLGRVFEPFVTTKSHDMGTGLGLSISRNIVEELGGSIEVESEVGVGTCFRVAIPHVRLERSNKQEKRPPVNQVGRKRILIVDDEIQVGTSLRRVLSGEHDVEVTVSAHDALIRIGELPAIDLILCDLMMPAMSGIELYRTLFEMNCDYAHRIIFMTGGVFTQQEQKFLNSLEHPWLAKPIDVGELKSYVMQWASSNVV